MTEYKNDATAPILADMLPRFLPFIRWLARYFGRGLSVETDDFIQDICIKALSSPPGRIVHDKEFQGWLRSVAIAVRVQHCRYQHSQKRTADIVSLNELSDGEGGAQYPDQEHIVWLHETMDIIYGMAASDATALFCAAVGDSHASIANHFGTSPLASRIRLTRARERLDAKMAR